MITYVVNVVAIVYNLKLLFFLDQGVVSVVVKWNFKFFNHRHDVVNVVAIGTWSLFSGWPWRRDCSSKVKFYIFLPWSQCSKRSAGIDFFIFVMTTAQ